MSKLLLSTVVLAMILAALPASRCTCEKAGENDLPHGANEVVEYTKTTVKSIKGRVAYAHDDSPVDQAVVEVFQVAPADKKLSAYRLVRERERRVACVTSKDGSFCFDDLPSGDYVVRAGTRSANAGMNEVYVTVNLHRSWWSRWFTSGKRLNLHLTPGT